MTFDGFGDDLATRTHALNEHPVSATAPDGKPAAYILCWLQQALRGHDNPTIDAAIEIGNRLGLPVLVYHGLRMDYPHASDRLHRFILGASRDLARECEARRLACATYVETSDHREKGLVYRLAARAAAIVTDEQFAFVARWQAASFAAGHEGAVIAVDANRLVPTRILPDGIKGTPAFRKASVPHRDEHLAHAFDFDPDAAPYDGPLPFEPSGNGARSDADLDAFVAACAIDHTLPVSAEFPATSEAVTKRLDTFIEDHLAAYDRTRNNPAEEDGVSNLSPYIHFGMIGPRRIARAAHEAGVKSNPRWKFLDELLSWREMFHYFMFHTPVPESFDTVPARPRESLLAHAGDERPYLYTLSELIHGETHDETWNASQRQWLATGYMHNNLRMYWSKQIIEWTPHPRDAWITACYLNDRLSIDGRDPSTYGNMISTFGRGRPAYSEQPIYGWVPPKRDTALRKRPGANEWLADWATRDVPRIHVPNAAFVAPGFEERFTAG